jgi:hypothetical protein
MLRALSCGPLVLAVVASAGEPELRARLSFVRGAPPAACEGVWPALAAGQRIPAAVLGRVQRVEVVGDAVDLPEPWLLAALLEGVSRELKPGDQPMQGPVIQVQVRLADRCLALSAFPSMGRLVGAGLELGVPSVPCAAKVAGLHRGLSRAELEALASPDGGLAVPISRERFVLTGCAEGPEHRVVKVKVAFTPRPSSDAGPVRPGAGDVVARVSPPYLEVPFSD